MRNVVIVTNMWGLPNAAAGESREIELRTDPQLFQPAIEQGATMRRHDNTVGSAHAILSRLLNDRPITRGSSNPGPQTAADQNMARMLAALQEKHDRELAEVRKSMGKLKRFCEGLMDQIEDIKVDRDRKSVMKAKSGTKANWF